MNVPAVHEDSRPTTPAAQQPVAAAGARAPPLKRDDLLRDGKYALQTFPQPKPGSDEFYIAGKAVLVDDQAACANILRDAKHMADASETAFELWIDRVMHTTWEHVLTPQMRAKHRKWRAPTGQIG